MHIRVAYLAPLLRFKRSNSGATAVEFAIIAPVFMLIIMAIVEVSLIFFATVNLDGAATEAARRIRTGQAQQSGDSLTDFSTTLCGKLDTMFDCGKLQKDVRTMSSFSAIQTAVNQGIEYDPITGEPITFGFSPGTSGNIVVVRVMYLWSINTPLMATFFETLPGTSKILLASTAVFQNEPYE